MKKSLTTFRFKAPLYNDRVAFGHHLAGLWEGDGNINIKDKSFPKPTLHITLHIQQEPFVKKYMLFLRSLCKGDPVGSIHLRQDNNSCVLNVYTPVGLKCVFDLIHDKLKTPKAYQLNLIGNWLNKHHKTGCSQVKPNAVFSLNTPWFAGFTDADGSFGIDFRSKPRQNVVCQFQINQRMQDPKSGLGYDELFHGIAQALCVKLYTIKPNKKGRPYYAIKASSFHSRQILRNYFDTYSLLTSKYLDYRDWCTVDELIKKRHKEKPTFRTFLKSKRA